MTQNNAQDVKNVELGSAHVVLEIAARLKAVEHIEITDDTTGNKYYGYNIGIGNNTLKSLWHCGDDRTHPDEAEYLAKGWDIADLYCDSHYASKDDDAMLTFLLNAQQDIRLLLDTLAAQQPSQPEREVPRCIECNSTSLLPQVVKLRDGTIDCYDYCCSCGQRNNETITPAQPQPTSCCRLCGGMNGLHRAGCVALAGDL